MQDQPIYEFDLTVRDVRPGVSHRIRRAGEHSLRTVAHRKIRAIELHGRARRGDRFGFMPHGFGDGEHVLLVARRSESGELALLPFRLTTESRWAPLNEVRIAESLSPCTISF